MRLLRPKNRTNGSPPAKQSLRRWFAALAAFLIATLGVITLPSAAMADPNNDIVVDQVTIGGGSGPNGQLVIGDTIEISGSWDASAANPQEGDEFTIGLPSELDIPANVPFNLTGPRPDGSDATWATCMADADTDIVTCTLTDEVTANPESVLGEFLFEVNAVEATTEESLIFDLNGTDTPVELPGEGGIDDGIVIPDEWGKSGEMNSNNWSMTWEIELPGASLQGHDVINIADQLSDNHQLCEPSGFKIETVRGDTVVDVTGIGEIVPDASGNDFTIRLTQPDGDFDPNVTYVITYQTCTPDGQIDPVNTVYENEAIVDIWGDSSGVIGTSPKPWQGSMTKSGSVLGGADRNGKIRWTVTVPGEQLVGKDGFNFQETLGAGHEICLTTIEDISITERYGPSNQRDTSITDKLAADVVSSSAQAFEIDYTITDDGFAFKASDYRYIITYVTCVTETDLPEGGTGYTNEVEVDGVVAGNEAKVPGRNDAKSGRINTSAVTIDGVEYLPQTTLNWTIVVPGERLADLDSPLVVTDTLSETQQVCAPGDSTGGLDSQLRLRVEARDQINNGGLSTVSLTDSVEILHDGQNLTFTIPQPTLPLPDGTTATGFSTEYQYVFDYYTCTTTGGMDAPGTVYGNDAEVAGKTYSQSVTQNNRGSGSGQGQPRGTVAIEKNLADTPGAAFVPEDAVFTVHVQEFPPNSETALIEYDLQIPLNGDPVSGPNSRGTGWTAVLTEPTFPSIPGVVFGDPVFAEADGVTVNQDGTQATAALVPGSNISVSLTNEAQLGSVEITKEITGGAADVEEADREFTVTASIDTSALGDDFPAQADRVFTISDGETVALDDLPIGAAVTFTETVPEDDDQLTWGEPVFAPTSVTITGEHVDEPAAVTLTNSVERTVGTFSLVKNVTGEQAENPAVPETVTVTATWDEEGTPGEKVLQIPTDGTPVPLDENLLIGTKVTLTETALEDGSSIAWGAPTWSGTGVEVDGESAIVTVGRDGDAIVTLENHAATSVAELSFLKGIAGEAAEEVDDTTEFPVTVTWTDAEGVEQTRPVTINAAEPTGLGEELPAGTVVTITEGERPGIDTVIWGEIVISGEGVEDNGDGSATVVVSDQQDDMTLVTVVNEATWAPGTFLLAKNVTGVLLDNPDVPESVNVVASWFEDGEPVSAPLVLPTDGSTVEFGVDLPHGTEVTLAEEAIADSAAFTWDAPVWEAEGITLNDDGTATITIGAAQNLDVTLTNNATASTGSLLVTKTLSGDGADEVSSDVVFPVTATWTNLLGEAQQVELEVTAGEAAVLEGLPLGTEVTIVEGETNLPESITWEAATWSSDDESVVIAGEGSEVVVTVTGEAGTEAAITLDNEFERVPEPEKPGPGPDLPQTGNGFTIGALVLGLGLLVGGSFLVIRQRRA